MKKLKEEKKRVRSHFIEMASRMPLLSHWPEKEKPFDYSESEVVKWLLSQPGIGRWIFDKARCSGAIVFDGKSGRWCGKLTESNPSGLASPLDG